MKRSIFPQLSVFALPKRILSYNVGCEILSPSGTAAVAHTRFVRKGSEILKERANAKVELIRNFAELC
jgi:hypothetical protein